MMDMTALRRSVERIKLSDEARGRIVRNCRTACANAGGGGRGRRVGRRLVPAAAAAAALCLCLAAAAAAYGLGFFRDVVRWDGAVVGSRYEQATEEITVRVLPAGNGITVVASMAYPDKFPYRALESLGIGSCRIEDGSGKVVATEGPTDMAEISDGEARIELVPDGLPAGDYRLFIDAFTGGAKADQPLPIYGAWECDFTI